MSAQVYTGTLSLNELSPSEQVLKEITVSVKTRINSIWIYFGNLTVDAYIRLYKKDIGGTYRTCTFISETPTSVGIGSGTTLYNLMHNMPAFDTNTDIKITIESAGAGIESEDVTYEIDYDNRVDDYALDSTVAKDATVSKPGTAQTITAPADMALNSTVAKDATVSKPGIAQTITVPADMALNSTVAKEATLVAKIPTALSFNGANVLAESVVTASPTLIDYWTKYGHGADQINPIVPIVGERFTDDYALRPQGGDFTSANNSLIGCSGRLWIQPPAVAGTHYALVYGFKGEIFISGRTVADSFLIVYLFNCDARIDAVGGAENSPTEINVIGGTGFLNSSMSTEAGSVVLARILDWDGLNPGSIVPSQTNEGPTDKSAYYSALASSGITVVDGLVDGLVVGVADIKGTGFAKDTDSLVNLTHELGDKGSDIIYDSMQNLGNMVVEVQGELDILQPKVDTLVANQMSKATLKNNLKVIVANQDRSDLDLIVE